MNNQPPKEPVWSFRGYELRPGDFTTAMVHLFRAEITRANVWRQRLDATTNWAVVSTGAVITFAFSQNEGPHVVILLNTILVTMFLLIEARRYRYYELWSSRVRLMETDFYAAMLVPPFHPAPDWAESLAENLLHPKFPITMWEAIGRRYRRNYMWIYIILGLAWVAKLGLFPTQALTFNEIIQRAAIGPGSGGIVFLLWGGFNVFLLIMGLLTISLHQATGEVLPQFADDLSPREIRQLQKEGGRIKGAWFRPHRERRQLMAWVITLKPEEISKRIITEMQRSATLMPGVGQFTHEPHPVLLVVVTITEVAQLKAIIREEDPKAFLVVNQAYEVLGLGFKSIEE